MNNIYVDEFQQKICWTKKKVLGNILNILVLFKERTMITKERLKELIKQGATIYGVICDDYYYEEVLDKKYYISSFDDKTSLHKKGYGFIDYLENLYESKEEAD